MLENANVVPATSHHVNSATQIVGLTLVVLAEVEKARDWRDFRGDVHKECQRLQKIR